MATKKQYAEFERVFVRYYDGKDYWQERGEHGVVTSALKLRQRMIEDGNVTDISSEAEVVKSFRNNMYKFAQRRFAELEYLLPSTLPADIQRLADIARYDQRFTLELLGILTGRKFVGLSNKRIAVELAKERQNEVHNRPT